MATETKKVKYEKDIITVSTWCKAVSELACRKVSYNRGVKFLVDRGYIVSDVVVERGNPKLVYRTTPIGEQYVVAYNERFGAPGERSVECLIYLTQKGVYHLTPDIIKDVRTPKNLPMDEVIERAKLELAIRQGPEAHLDYLIDGTLDMDKTPTGNLYV